MDEERLRSVLGKMPFYHTIPLTPAVSTPGWPVVVPIVRLTQTVLEEIDLTGKRVLDIGCRDGLFCFQAEKNGAAEVIGFDYDLTPGVTEFLIDFFRSRARIVSWNLFDLRPETFGNFDVVIFAGVLYHLRYPCYALKLIREVLNQQGLLVIETAILADDNLHPMMYCPVGAESPYESTCVSFFNRKALHDTLASMGFIVEQWRCLMNLRTRPGRALAEKPPIDRCVTVCRKSGGTDEVHRYWDGVPNTLDPRSWDGKPRRIA